MTTLQRIEQRLARIEALLQPRAIDPNGIYSTEEAARLTTLAPYTVRHYLRVGIIRGKGRPWRIKGSELLKLA